MISLPPTLSIPPFRPAPWLRNPHVQTLFAAAVRPRPRLALCERKFRGLGGEDIYTFCLRERPGAPWVVLLHGLEGSARSPYIMGMLAAAARRGWNACVMEYRGCGGREVTAPRFYYSGDTADAQQLLRLMARRYGRDQIFLAGFSLGGNVGGKLLGEAGSDAPVRAAALVSAPYKLAPVSPFIDEALGGLYTWNFMRSLKAKARSLMARFPGILDPASVEAARTLLAFDDAVTAPLHGFADAWDYYEKASSAPLLHRIAVPTLLISAQDDPLIPAAAFPRHLDGHPHLSLLFPEHGGHLGFVEGPHPGAARYWAEEAVMAFFAAQAPTIDAPGHTY